MAASKPDRQDGPRAQKIAALPHVSIVEIKALPVSQLATEKSHLYLWVPNALLPWGLDVVSAWGYDYKAVLTWYKVRKDGGPDGRGVGFYFRNVTSWSFSASKEKIIAP